MQYGFCAQYGGNLFSSGSNGFEGDNNENGFDVVPRSEPRICNATLVGAKGQPGGDVFAFGALLRRGTAGHVLKSLFVDWNTAGTQLRDTTTANLACGAGPQMTGFLDARDSIFFDNGSDGATSCSDSASTNGADCSSCQLFALWTADGTAPVRVIDPGLDPNVGKTWPPPIPNPGAATLSSAIDCHAIDPYFDTTDYVGAFRPGGPSWLTAPWIDLTVD